MIKLRSCAAFVSCFAFGAGMVIAQTGTPPHLARNQPVFAFAGQTTVITSTNLLTTDLETVDPAEIIYTISPDDPNGAIPEGSLYLGVNALKAGDHFSQDDVNNNVLTWHALPVIDEPGVGIPFNVRDFDGNLASDGGHTTFSLSITYSNTPPVAFDGNLVAALGTGTAGTLTATNAETFQTLKFKIVAQPQKGSVVLLDATNGTYLFTATVGKSGDDFFTFQVSDGVTNATNPGTIFVSITNTPPIVPPQQFPLRQDDKVDGVIITTDIDLPVQPRTINVITPPLRGHFDSFDPVSGRFRYRPDAGRFGYDSFVVSATDGQAESAYQTIILPIRPIPDEGSVFVIGSLGVSTNNPNGDGVLCQVNPANGDTFRMFEDGSIRDAISVLYNPRRDEFIFGGSGNGKAFVGAVNINTGDLRPLFFSTNSSVLPISFSFDHQGNVLAGLGPGGIGLIDPIAGGLTVLASGGFLETTSDVWEEPGGNLLALDAVQLFDDSARVVEIDRTTGHQTELFPDNILLDPAQFFMEDTNRLLIVARGGLFELNRSANTLNQLLPKETFKALGKSIVPDGSGGFVMVDLQTRLLRVHLPDTNVSVINTEFNFSPLHATTFHIPATLAEWRANYFSAADLADPTKEASVWGDRADPDGDGAPNALEFALGLNPLVPDSTQILFTIDLGTSGGNPVALLSFPVRKALGASHYAPQVSSDFVNWSSAGFELDSVQPASSLFERHVMRYPVLNTGASTPRFFRLQILP